MTGTGITREQAIDLLQRARDLKATFTSDVVESVESNEDVAEYTQLGTDFTNTGYLPTADAESEVAFRASDRKR